MSAADPHLSTLLVIGASVLQVPAIHAAHSRGLGVAVVDQDAAAPGAVLADAFYQVSTIDEQAIRSLALELQPVGVVTLGTDRPVRSVAAACEALGLPGLTPEAAILATDKHLMARRFHDHGLSAPAFVLVADVDDPPERLADLDLPLISKPVDSSGSRGVVRVDQPGDLPAAMRYSASFSSSGQVLLEAFVQGPEVSVEMLCVGDEPHVVAVTEKSTTGAPHFVETGHAQPARLSAAQLEDVTDLSRAAARALGLSDCAAHVEIVLSDSGPQLIEVGARLGGDFIATHLTPLSTGIDMVDAIIAIATGAPCPVRPVRLGASAVRFGHLPGTLDNVRFESLRDEALDRTGASDLGLLSATSSASPASSLERGAYAVGVGTDHDAALRRCTEALRCLGATPYPTDLAGAPA